MSSSRSPDLRLELRTDWRVIAALLAWITLAIGSAWSAALPPALAAVVSALILIVAVPAVVSQVFVQRRAGMVLVWSADDSWTIRYASGTFQPLELSPASRVFPGGALLLFRARQALWLLLLERSDDGGALRRLRLRLNLVRRRKALPQAGMTTDAGTAGPGGS